MTKNKGHWVFLLSAIYLVLHYMQHHEIGPSIIRYYAKDLILVPLLLGCVSMTSQFFNKHIQIGTKEVAIAVVYCGIVFELVLPRFAENVHFDFIDLVCYCIGGAAWHFIIGEKQQKLVDKSVS